jgi:hypothetical protein
MLAQVQLPNALEGWPFAAERDWVDVLSQVSGGLKASVTTDKTTSR